MKVNSDIKMDIWFLEAEGRYDEVINKLLKIKMSATQYDCIGTEIFINHSLSESYFKKNNKDFANYYLNLNGEIFEDKQTFQERKLEYYKYLWLYSEVNKDTMSKEEYCKNFMEIYRYFNEINDYRLTNKTMEKMVFDNYNKEEIVIFFVSAIKIYGKEDEIIKDLVENCKKFDNQIYITIERFLNEDSEEDIAI